MILMKDVMSHPVHTLSTENSLADARKMMQEQGIRHIPVVNAKNKLEGLVTQRDVFAAMDSSVYDMPPELMEAHESEIPVTQVMRTKVATASLDTPIRKAAEFLQTKKYGCLPVVENGHVVGILTGGDFIKIAINLLDLVEVEPEEEPS
ncbi:MULTISPECIES: CBS domain-containing protein [Hahella]|uniref:CBS-domain-containing membrane protein n=1 Tax=Hahella chejuensis (strain KCTC 2396) TaxID=349521 RepID=Q2SQE0_HAHCH|nr:MULTISPECIES: CBS domain-containing protein [Hahella]ABC27134.1 CBS-domain-containing membrane protein [Hahella chejuensis KCTC 2396]AZZ89837.1 CBS domain-containing protein [Hahella sp. KA22]MBU6950381.1 CBS domain-containing protein [Hahella sp. HN01]MDG9666285.1 CBS domain-containing protein [Hahella sp. CR1]QAY53206.1 CBS domain-containing protein [Hahella sp. KA22]